VDERYHIEKSTEAFCKYMKEAYAEFGSWTLAAASYNMGIAGVRKQVERQNMNNYFKMMFNDETSRYLFRMIAVKVVMENPLAYGYGLEKKDLYETPVYSVITIDSGITDMATFAEKFKMNYKMLKVLNPWLRQSFLINKDKKTYEIKITKN
jgi:membrane-bound lytic murein transglycosylase D